MDSQKVTAPELIEYHEQLTAWENTVNGVNSSEKCHNVYISHSVSANLAFFSVLDAAHGGHPGVAQRSGSATQYNNRHSSTGDNYEDCDELDPFFDPAAARLDGLFNGNPPVLAHTLLEAEQVPSAIAKLSASHLQLSRATQRLLREVVGSMENIKLRQKWQQMNRSSNSSGAQAGVEEKSAYSSGKEECVLRF